jgi:hypothetical protein
MGNSKKYSMDEKQDVFQEPATVYGTTFTEKLDPSNTDEQEILLRKLLEKSLEESKMRLGISNKEMKRRTKLRYPFLK